MELTTISGSRDETLKAVLDKAAERVGECDSVLVLMQKKTGGVIWEAHPELDYATMLWIAQGFVHWLLTKSMEG
jgi:hypothetical protein